MQFHSTWWIVVSHSPAQSALFFPSDQPTHTAQPPLSWFCYGVLLVTQVELVLGARERAVLWHSISSTQSERVKATILKFLSTVSQNSKLWSYTSFYTELRVSPLGDKTHCSLLWASVHWAWDGCLSAAETTTEHAHKTGDINVHSWRRRRLRGPCPSLGIYRQLMVTGGSQTETDNRDKHDFLQWCGYLYVSHTPLIKSYMHLWVTPHPCPYGKSFMHVPVGNPSPMFLWVTPHHAPIGNPSPMPLWEVPHPCACGNP